MWKKENLFLYKGVQNILFKFIKRSLSTCLAAGILVSSFITPSMAQEDLTIETIRGNTPEVVSVEIHDYLYDDVHTVYLVSLENYVDAIGAITLLENENSSLFYVGKDGLNEKVEEKVKNADRVVLIGGEGAVEAKYDDLENVVERISGTDRYETALKVAKKNYNASGVIIANGDNPVDALAAGPLALEKNYNLLLIGNSLPASVKDYLRNYQKDIYFVGGDAAISDDLKKEIFELAGKKEDIKDYTISGRNRYLTSVEIAKEFNSFNEAILATGDDMLDSLSSGNLSKGKNIPILLHNEYQEEGIIEFIKEKDLAKIYAVTTKDNISDEDSERVLAKIRGDYVELETKEEPEEVVETFTGWVTSGLNVRTGPGVNFQRVGRLNYGDKVSGVIVDGWLKMERNGQEVYSSMKYISDKEIKRTPVAGGEDVNGTIEGVPYSKVMTMESTAYTPNAGGWGITATGTVPKQGTIAVDPRVIPLGTRMYVEGYGFGIAEDTGGAIKGNIVDVCLPNRTETRKWGRRQVKVYILD